MSITGNYRHYVRTGGRSRAPYSPDHITNVSVYGTRPVVPPNVLREREERMLADTRTDIERWLGNPEPGRSALDAHRQREREREAAALIRPSISACPTSRNEVNARSAQAAAASRVIARKLEPEPPPPSWPRAGTGPRSPTSWDLPDRTVGPHGGSMRDHVAGLAQPAAG
jgi:hypothetical protein